MFLSNNIFLIDHIFRMWSSSIHYCLKEVDWAFDKGIQMLSLSHVVSTFWPFIRERRTDHTMYTHTHTHIQKKKRSRKGGEKKSSRSREIFKTCFWLPLELVSFESSGRSANGISTLDPILRYFIGKIDNFRCWRNLQRILFSYIQR